MTTSLDNLKHVCSDIETEVSILKGTLEANFRQNINYSPMLTFFGPDNKRQIAVVIPSAETFEDTVIRLTEALHLYVALNSNCVTISLRTKTTHNNNNYDTLNLFLLSETHAWQLTYPYSIDDSNNIVWHNDLHEIEAVDEIEYDSNIKEMITAFYCMTHLIQPAFTVSEIISYLSSQNAAIQLLDGQKIAYIDFSNNYV